MGRHVLGILIAAIVLFIWGFAYWVLSPFADALLLQPNNETVAQARLSEQFSEKGVYMVPSMQSKMEEGNSENNSYQAFVHVMVPQGGTMSQNVMMIQGFILNVVFSLIVFGLLQFIYPAIPTLVTQFKFFAFVGLASALLIDGGDIIWWMQSPAWNLYRGFYHLSSWVIVGLVLCKFQSARSTVN